MPTKRQTLFFSATMPKPIAELADAYLTDPVEVAVAPRRHDGRRIEQSRHLRRRRREAGAADADPAEARRWSARSSSRAPSMAPTRSCASSSAAGITADAIHGNKSQGQRERALGAFRDGERRGPGRDRHRRARHRRSGVTHVVQLRPARTCPSNYVHRIGRTARAGASGIAIAFCSRDERVDLKDIEKLTRLKLPETALPEGFMAAVEAIKRLKPAPKQTDSRERQPHGGRRFTPTAALKPGHSRGGPRRDGGSSDERRNSQNSSGPRANPLRDNTAQPQRHPQRADGHAAHRPATAGDRPGQPNRPFHGRRRPAGNRAQG